MTEAPREPLSVDDAAILALESEAIAGHTMKVIVLEPGDEPLSLERLRETVGPADAEDANRPGDVLHRLFAQVLEYQP